MTDKIKFLAATPFIQPTLWSYPAVCECFNWWGSRSIVYISCPCSPWLINEDIFTMKYVYFNNKLVY